LYFIRESQLRLLLIVIVIKWIILFIIVILSFLINVEIIIFRNICWINLTYFNMILLRKEMSLVLLSAEFRFLIKIFLCCVLAFRLGLNYSRCVTIYILWFWPTILPHYRGIMKLTLWWGYGTQFFIFNLLRWLNLVRSNQIKFSFLNNCLGGSFLWLIPF